MVSRPDPNATATEPGGAVGQAPALLDLLRPDEVVVVEREDGGSTFKRLDADALQDWLNDYRLSELFDRGVLGGRP